MHSFNFEVLREKNIGSRVSAKIFPILLVVKPEMNLKFKEFFKAKSAIKSRNVRVRVSFTKSACKHAEMRVNGNPETVSL